MGALAAGPPVGRPGAGLLVRGLGGTSSIAVACLPGLGTRFPSPWLSVGRLTAITAGLALAEAQANVAAARSALVLAQSDYARVSRVTGDEAVSAGEVDALRGAMRCNAALVAALAVEMDGCADFGCKAGATTATGAFTVGVFCQR